MSIALIAGVGALGGLGAVARYLIDGGLSRRFTKRLLVGTLAVNLSGALALGVLAGAVTDTDAIRLAATGLLGSYTTFSTWMYESQRLGESNRPRSGVANIAFSLIAGFALAWAGFELGQAL